MRSLVYTIILIIITGCSYSSSKTIELDKAQRLLPNDPEAAMRYLNGIDILEFRDSATMARWALLYSEAMVANRLTAPTDTIINIAIDYYDAHDRHDEFRKATHLKALLKSNTNRDELATALYLQKEKEFMLYKERATREQIVFVAIIIFIAATSIIVLMRQRLKIKSTQNDILMAEASNLKCRIDVQTKDVDRLKSTLHSLLENRFALIDSLCQTYYESHGTKSERKAIADKVKSEIDAVRNDSFADIEHAVNCCRDNLLIKITEAYPTIKTTDYQLTVLLAAGFSTRTISLLLGESVDTVYKRKSRLKAKLKTTCHIDETYISAIF